MNRSQFKFQILFSLLFFICFSISCVHKKGKNIDTTTNSYEVHNDGTITFWLNTHKAKTVKLNIPMNGLSIPMKKVNNDLWRITVGPLLSDIYAYSFEVDGYSIIDPLNPNCFTSGQTQYSLVEVSGNSFSFYSMQHIPHGKIISKYCDSNDLDESKKMIIYTPPGYNEFSTRRYPVLYLISCPANAEDTYINACRINFMLDYLIAQQKAKSMIVVMLNAIPSDCSSLGSKQSQNYSDVEFNHLNNVLKFIEQNYSVGRESNDRAIGGIFGGGCEALRFGFREPYRFPWIFVYNSYLQREEFLSDYKSFYSYSKLSNEKLKLLSIGVDDSDLEYHQTIDFINMLKGYDINCNSLIISEKKMDISIRLYFNEIIQLLFQK